MIIVAGGEKGEKFMEMDPASPIMPSISSIESVEKAIEQFPGIRAFNSSEQTLTPEQVDEAHKYGIMVFTNTLGWGDSETFMRHVMDLGSDALQTDSPKVLLKTKKKVKKEQEKE